jgi:predicted Zn-dependent protease
MELELQAPPPVGGGSRAVAVAVAAAVLVLIAGAGYVYTKRSATAPQVAQVPAMAPVPTAVPAVIPTPATGIAPADAETASLKREGETQLRDGKAEQAEAASNKAATNEMLKVAIAKMAQGKLDDAEKELNAARGRDYKEPLVYYNLAVLRLKQARTDEALNQFEAAFMSGFKHYKEMDGDPDLDALRKNPRFAELVKKYRPVGG